MSPRKRKSKKGSVLSGIGPLFLAFITGAVTVMFGTVSMYAISYRPMCVWPSGPTIPARSMQKITGRFWMATSCTIESYARCRNVE